MQNDMRDRLVEILLQKTCHYSDIPCDNECGVCGNIELYRSDIEKLADHLIANGVIIPPCKIDDDIWVLKGDIKNGWETLKPTHAEKISGGFSYGMLDKNGDLKSTFYLSKEQAEEKLN